MKVKIRGHNYSRVINFDMTVMRSSMTNEERELVDGWRDDPRALNEYKRMMLKYPRGMYRSTWEHYWDNSDEMYIDTGIEREWDDSIHVMSINHIIIEGVRYNVKSVTIDSDGVYVIDSDYKVKTDDGYLESHYKAVSIWMNKYYSDCKLFSDMIDKQHSPTTLELEVLEFDKQYEKKVSDEEEISRHVDSFLDEYKGNPDHAVTAHKVQVGLIICSVSAVASVLAWWLL